MVSGFDDLAYSPLGGNHFITPFLLSFPHHTSYVVRSYGQCTVLQVHVVDGGRLQAIIFREVNCTSKLLLLRVASLRC